MLRGLEITVVACRFHVGCELVRVRGRHSWWSLQDVATVGERRERSRYRAKIPLENPCERALASRDVLGDPESVLPISKPKDDDPCELNPDFS